MRRRRRRFSEEILLLIMVPVLGVAPVGVVATAAIGGGVLAVVAAPLPPTIRLAIQDDPNNDGITNINSPTFVGEADSISTVTILSGDEALTSVQAEEGTYTIPLTAIILSDGEYFFSAQAKNPVGRRSKRSESLAIIIDAGAPTYGTPIVSPEANGNRWHNTDVTVRFSCTDATSGPVQDTVIRTITGEGFGRSASAPARECQDLAGNQASSGQILGEINIDRTVPSTVTSIGSTSHRPSSWAPYNRVDVAWGPAEDSLSGVDGYSVVWDTSPATNPDPTIDIPDINTVRSPDLPDGQKHYFHISALDQAGNVGPVSHLGPFWIDTGAPIYGTPIVSPEANGNGWHNTDVTVQFPCTDATSGPVRDEIVYLVNSEGSNLTATADATDCVDMAGNGAREGKSVDGISVDKTGPYYGTPTISPLASRNDWYNDVVTVMFPCIDTASGPAMDEVIRTISSEGANQSVSVPASACQDLADNPASAGRSLTGINIDSTRPIYGAPIVSPEANGNGWHNTDVTVRFLCTDATSGPVQDTVIRTITGEGFHLNASAAASECQDLAGNQASLAQTLEEINIDKTGPSSVTSIRSTSHNLSSWALSRRVNVVWDPPEDSLSGLDGYSLVWDTSPGTIPDNESDIPDISSARSPDLPDGQDHYIHIRAVDRAGNAGSVSHLGPFWIDTGAPIYGNPGVSPEPNGNGWNNTDVTVRFPCTDATSGPVEDPVLSMITTEGPNQIARAEASDCRDRADNSAIRSGSLEGINIDKTAPSTVINLESSHTPATWSSDRTIDVLWTAAEDSPSGLDGYSVVWDTSPSTTPDNLKELDANVTRWTSPELPDGQAHYFHILAVDRAGNRSTRAAHLGPFWIAVPPDLTVSISGPSTARPGADIAGEMRVIIENIGGSSVPLNGDGFIVVDIKLSTDSYLPVEFGVPSENFFEDVLLIGGRDQLQQTLGPGESASVSLGDERIPREIPPGTYCLGAVVDPGQVIGESSESNNTRCHWIQILPQGTITVSGISSDPPLYFGERVTVSLEYSTSATGGVRILAQPYFNDSYATRAAFEPSPILTAQQGRISRYITVLDDPEISSPDPVTVNQIRVLMIDAETSQLLFETFVKVNYRFMAIRLI